MARVPTNTVPWSPSHIMRAPGRPCAQSSTSNPEGTRSAATGTRSAGVTVSVGACGANGAAAWSAERPCAQTGGGAYRARPAIGSSTVTAAAVATHCLAQCIVVVARRRRPALLQEISRRAATRDATVALADRLGQIAAVGRRHPQTERNPCPGRSPASSKSPSLSRSTATPAPSNGRIVPVALTGTFATSSLHCRHETGLAWGEKTG